MFALGVAGDSLYVGGQFATAGGKASPGFARAIIGEGGADAPPALSIEESGRGVILRWPSASSDSYTLEQSPDPTTPGMWQPVGIPVDDDGATKSVTLPRSEEPAGFFRLRKP